MGKMSLAVLDSHGEVIHSWDDARIAQETIRKVTAKKIAPFRPRLRQKVETALQEAVDAFLLEVARK